MAQLTVDTSELEAVTDLLRRRADTMMQDAISEGQMRASTPFKRPLRPGPRTSQRTNYLRSGRRIVRQTMTTPAEIARWIERVLYHRFLDFWGDW